jgi:hypothetical protein
MPLIEVDEITHRALAENGIKFADASDRLKKAAEIETTFIDLTSDPRTRPELARLLKLKYPDKSVPDVDLAAPIVEKVDGIQKKLDEWVAEQAKKEEERETKAREAAAHDTVSKGRSWLRRERKLDEDGIEAVETVMKDLGIPNYEVAFNHWKAQQPAEPQVDLPSSYARSRLDWFTPEEDQPDKKLLLQDPLAYRAKRTEQVLRDFRSGKMDEFGRPIARSA